MQIEYEPLDDGPPDPPQLEERAEDNAKHVHKMRAENSLRKKSYDGFGRWCWEYS